MVLFLHNIAIISTIISLILSKEMVGDCTPRYIGHDIDSEMASNLRMLCLAVLLLRYNSEKDKDNHDDE